MNYQYNITRYQSLKDTRLWTDRIWLAVLLLAILSIAFYNSTLLNIIVVSLSALLLTAVILLFRIRRKIPFVEITDGTLSYFDSEIEEMVSVPLQDITHVSTRFCRLNIHTPHNTHSINLGLIRNEKTRWEIKEVIRDSVN